MFDHCLLAVLALIVERSFFKGQTVWPLQAPLVMRMCNCKKGCGLCTVMSLPHITTNSSVLSFQALILEQTSLTRRKLFICQYLFFISLQNHLPENYDSIFVIFFKQLDIHILHLVLQENQTFGQIQQTLHSQCF